MHNPERHSAAALGLMTLILIYTVAGQAVAAPVKTPDGALQYKASSANFTIGGSDPFADVAIYGEAAEAMYVRLALPEVRETGENGLASSWNKSGAAVFCRKSLSKGIPSYECHVMLELDDTFTKLTGKGTTSP